LKQTLSSSIFSPNSISNLNMLEWQKLFIYWNPIGLYFYLNFWSFRTYLLDWIKVGSDLEFKLNFKYTRAHLSAFSFPCPVPHACHAHLLSAVRSSGLEPGGRLPGRTPAPYPFLHHVERQAGPPSTPSPFLLYFAASVAPGRDKTPSALPVAGAHQPPPLILFFCRAGLRSSLCRHSTEPGNLELQTQRRPQTPPELGPSLCCSPTQVARAAGSSAQAAARSHPGSLLFIPTPSSMNRAVLHNPGKELHLVSAAALLFLSFWLYWVRPLFLPSSPGSSSRAGAPSVSPTGESLLKHPRRPLLLIFCRWALSPPSSSCGC
jgi:hypothetical protein